MKKLVTLIVLTAALALSVNSTAGDNAALEKLLDDYARSVTTLDLDLAESIWSQQSDISFIHPRGHQRGWEDIRDTFYLKTMGGFTARELKIKNVTIRELSDDTAWSDFYWDFDATFPDGSNIKTQGRETQVWKKEDGDWKIVHVHYSGPATQRERAGF